MNKIFQVRSTDGGFLDIPGIDTPVPGLALITHDCDCSHSVLALLHARSGTVLFYASSAEIFGEFQWKRLRQIDWTRSAEELTHDPNLNEVLAAVLVITKGLEVGNSSATELDDVAPPINRY